MEHSSPKTISPTMSKLTEAVFMTVSGGVFGAAFGGITGTFIIAPMFSFIKTLNPFSKFVFSFVSVTINSRNAQDAFYTEARAMLSKLGLEKYEKNFKKGHLTDPTFPLLTDSVLQEVNIPPGPRLLILDHIKRYNKMVKDK